MPLDENLISGLFIALNAFAKESGKGAIDSLVLKEARFVYLNFGPIFIVVGCDREDKINEMQEKMTSIAIQFTRKYGNLEDWDARVDRFRPFSSVLEEVLKPKEAPAPKPQPVYAPPLSKNEIILEEFESVCAEFTCEMIKEETSNINVFLSRSLEEHYVININFKDYPEKPKMKFPRGLKKILGKPEEALLTLANWNSENPPHIVEMLRELESYLLKTIPTDATRLIIDKS